MSQGSTAPVRRSVKILVVDDHPLVRRAVTSRLKIEPNFDVVAEAENGVDAVHKAHELKPDVVVLDIIMPLLNGLEAARQIRKEHPEAAIVILSSHAGRRFIEEAKEIGARAYVSKSHAAEALVKAIQAATQNEEFFAVE
jgi:NarL family two-component system response regulator LiaR